jgi:hypothetical protein
LTQREEGVFEWLSRRTILRYHPEIFKFIQNLLDVLGISLIRARPLHTWHESEEILVTEEEGLLDLGS